MGRMSRACPRSKVVLSPFWSLSAVLCLRRMLPKRPSQIAGSRLAREQVPEGAGAEAVELETRLGL